jgi:Flp pilus assembly protein TadD
VDKTQSLALRIALIVVTGFLIYVPALHGAWLMDDDLYFPHNPLRIDPARLWTIWFAPGHFIEYYPLGETAQTLQWWLWGNNTLGYHLTNVLLHTAGALLLWRLLARFGLKLAWLGGLIFVVHPANVESVAWISEFKNVSSLPLFLLAATAWVDYVDRQQPRDYALALGFFLAAMLCKISMAPFPLVILLYAWWKRGRVTVADRIAVAPFFLISLALGTMTILAGSWFRQLQHSPPEQIAMGGILWRLDLAGRALAYYASRVFWPFPFDPMIPPWQIDPANSVQWLPWLVLIGGFAWFWKRRATWGRHALLGCGFFVLMIAPFLGFVPVSYMKISWVFDHFLYLPMIGLIGLVVAAADDLAERSPRTRFGVLLLILTPVALLGGASCLFSRAFERPALYYAVVAYNHPDWWVARNAYGNALRKQGDVPEALPEFQEALRLAPNRPEPLNNLGALYSQLRRFPEAIAAYQHAIALDPKDPQTHSGLGNVYLTMGRLPEAMAEYEAALKIAPDFAQAQNGLANALLNSGRLDEAQTHADEAVKLAPDYMEAHATLGLILTRQGRVDDAIAEFERAQAIAPDDPRLKQELETLQAAKAQK